MAKILSQIKGNVKKSLPFWMISGNVPGIFDTKIHDFSISISR